VSLSDSASFVEGVVFALLLVVLAALAWERFREPLNIFTAVLALATMTLVYVSWLQQRTLEKTDETWRAGERAFVFVTHNNVGWQRAKMINGEIVREFPVVWENSGNSPTRDLVVKLYCLPLGPLTIENPISSIDKAKRLPLLLGPKQNSWGGTCSYSTKLLKLVRDNGYHLYIAAMANYFDIFDEPIRLKRVLSSLIFLEILKISKRLHGRILAIAVETALIKSATNHEVVDGYTNIVCI
jgi:hypothetical protein